MNISFVISKFWQTCHLIRTNQPNPAVGIDSPLKCSKIVFVFFRIGFFYPLCINALGVYEKCSFRISKILLSRELNFFPFSYPNLSLYWQEHTFFIFSTTQNWKCRKTRIHPLVCGFCLHRNKHATRVRSDSLFFSDIDEISFCKNRKASMFHCASLSFLFFPRYVSYVYRMFIFCAILHGKVWLMNVFPGKCTRSGTFQIASRTDEWTAFSEPCRFVCTVWKDVDQSLFNSVIFIIEYVVFHLFILREIFKYFTVVHENSWNFSFYSIHFWSFHKIALSELFINKDTFDRAIFHVDPSSHT